MRRVCTVLAVMAFMSGATIYVAAQSDTQSLGDYARAVKKHAPAKSAPHVYDNDNIPKDTKLSVTGQESSETPADEANPSSDQESNGAAESGAAATQKQAGRDQGQADKEKKEMPEIKVGQSADEREQTIDSWKQQIADQKAKVDRAQQDLDMTQKEYQLKASEFYANTALRVQNPSAFAGDDAKFKEKIAEKQKALDDAKTKLEDMQDRAHKQGAPNSVTE